MAEFCLECLNRINGTNDSESKYVISKDLDFCEGCGKMKRFVIAARDTNFNQFFLFRHRSFGRKIKR